MTYPQINGSDLPVSPSKLVERTMYIQSDSTAIDGAMQRNRISTALNPQGVKYESIMTFEHLSAANFQTINNLFVTGSGIHYNNPTSKYGTLTFSGLPFIEEEGEYAPGDSLLSTLVVRIRQI